MTKKEWRNNIEKEPLVKGLKKLLIENRKDGVEVYGMVYREKDGLFFDAKTCQD